MIRGILILIFVITGAFAEAQSFMFLETNGNPAQDSYVRNAADTLGDEFILNCLNTSASNKNVKVRMNVLSTPGMCTNDVYFCDPIACYPSSITLSVAPFAINAQDTTTGALVPHIAAGFCCGDYSVSYTLFDVANESDSVSVTIYYTVAGNHCANGIEELNDHLLTAFPNPASTLITIPYQIDGESSARIFIFNIAGEKISEYHLPDHSKFLEADVRNLHNGIYFYALQTNSGHSDFKKIVILK